MLPVNFDNVTDKVNDKDTPEMSKRQWLLSDQSKRALGDPNEESEVRLGLLFLPFPCARFIDSD
jgi:hypothetical protein